MSMQMGGYRHMPSLFKLASQSELRYAVDCGSFSFVDGSITRQASPRNNSRCNLNSSPVRYLFTYNCPFALTILNLIGVRHSQPVQLLTVTAGSFEASGSLSLPFLFPDTNLLRSGHGKSFNGSRAKPPQRELSLCTNQSGLFIR